MLEVRISAKLLALCPLCGKKIPTPHGLHLRHICADGRVPDRFPRAEMTHHVEVVFPVENLHDLLEAHFG